MLMGTSYDERVLPSIGNEVLKATVAQFDAAELITQREVVSVPIGDMRASLHIPGLRQDP
jgi:prohibitin 1